MSEEDKKIEEENKEVETTQESVSDEAMSNIKDSSTWIDALLVVVYLIVISYSIFLLWIIAFAQFIFKLITKKPNKNTDASQIFFHIRILYVCNLQNLDQILAED